MRKSKRLSEPEPYVLMREVLPELTKEFKHMLRHASDRALAEQLHDLRIYGRCCDAPGCGTFYCVSSNEMTRLMPHRDGTRDPWVMAKGKIIEVHTDSEEVQEVLKRLFPKSEAALAEERAIKDSE